jgi:hypothetical protein
MFAALPGVLVILISVELKAKMTLMSRGLILFVPVEQECDC